MARASIEQISDWLRSTQMAMDLPDDEIERLSSVVVHERFKPGEAVFLKDMKGTMLHILAEGRIKITRSGPDGSEMLFSMVEPGGHFGEIALIDGGYRGVNAVAERSSYVLGLDREHLLPAIERNSKAGLRVARLVCLHLREAMANVENVGLRDAPRRLWGRFTYLAQYYGNLDEGTGAIRVDHGLSQQSLADSVGLTRVMVNRLLSVWRDQGLIEDGRGFVIILNPKALEDFVWHADEPMGPEGT